MRNLLSTLFLGTSLFACTSNSTTGDDTGDTGGTTQADSAAAVVDSADTTSAEGNLLMATIDGSGTASTDTGLAASGKLQANIALQFTPSGCATVTPGAAALKVMFNDCTGPRGLTHITGELDLTASISAQGVTIKGTSTGLEINGATLDVDATGTYAISGTGHTLTVSTSGSGVGPRGNTIDHDGTYTIGWDPATQCRSLDGAWSSSAGSASRSSTADLSQCGAGCPTGSISHTTVDGKTMTVTFDGTATAAWQLTADASGSAGGSSGSASVLSSGSLTLDCK